MIFLRLYVELRIRQAAIEPRFVPHCQQSTLSSRNINKLHPFKRQKEGNVIFQLLIMGFSSLFPKVMEKLL